MKLIAQQAFSWAHRGVQVEAFEEDQVIETDDADLITVATTEGWVVRADEEASDPVGDELGNQLDNQPTADQVDKHQKPTRGTRATK